MRTTVAQARQSRLPQAIGKLATDLPGICAYLNQAQQQLIYAGGETGWWGDWVRVAFQVSRCNPYLTLPRQFACIINLDVCRWPIRIQNQFYEMLEDGVGLQDFGCCGDWCGTLEGYERGSFCSMIDVSPTNQFLRVYMTDARDAGKRVLIGPCLDQNGNAIYTTDTANNNNQVNGFYLTLANPFATSGFIVTNFTGVQKDQTFGDVLLYQVDATTGAEVLLSRYGPDEVTPSYRRYYFNRLPNNCAPVVPGSTCVNPQPEPTTVTLTALCKLEFIPVSRDTDFLIVANIPALIEECKAIRYSDMDVPEAAALEAKSHAKAINLLNKELAHYQGKLNPAVNFAPFGKARLGRVMSAVRTG